MESVTDNQRKDTMSRRRTNREGHGNVIETRCPPSYRDRGSCIVIVDEKKKTDKGCSTTRKRYKKRYMMMFLTAERSVMEQICIHHSADQTS